MFFKKYFKKQTTPSILIRFLEKTNKKFREFIHYPIKRIYFFKK